MTAVAVSPALAAASRGKRRAEFFRVFNLQTIAVVFYLCLGVVVPRYLPVFALELNRNTINYTFTFLRQNLISGLTVLAPSPRCALGRSDVAGRVHAR